MVKRLGVGNGAGKEMAMKLGHGVPMIRVKELDEVVRFYGEVLGFGCENQMEGWATMRRDEAEMMIALPNEHEPFEKTAFTGSFYFRMTGVDELWKELRDKAEVVYPLENFDYGMREFAIRDNNGYMLQFGEEIG